MSRKLASIRKIAEIKPIPGADRIVAYRVDGWWVVDSVGKYKVNDLVVYAEPDSWIPNSLAPFLSKGNEPREFEGVKGERLRTIRLKNQLSQGLLLPLSLAFEKFEGSKFDEGQELMEFFFPGNDVTELLGILKWEAPIPAELAGDVKGSFPVVIPKTDQERIQNVDIDEMRQVSRTWEISEKVDGSSMTVYLNRDEFGVCSRNWDMKDTPGNTLWMVAKRENLETKLQSTGRNLALQGEIVGFGIQGNSYKLKNQDFFVYNIFDIDRGEYLLPVDRRNLCEQLGLKQVPLIDASSTLAETMTIDELLLYAEGKSVLSTNASPEREGLVFKSNTDRVSFKTVSNRWLIKTNN
jgi:RNA ligase (TIGR02306 family)